MARKRWISETIHNGIGVRISLEATRILHEVRTGNQDLILFEHADWGKVLVLDGAIQLTTRDEFIYHEMMAHVPLLAHGRAQEVLVIGGGDCGLAGRVLAHPGVRRLTQVEIDASVVDFARQYFPEFTGPAEADPRFTLLIADGMDYVAETDRRFDVVIVDSTDPDGPGAALFTKEFYAGCRRCLTPGGVLVTQSGAPFLQGQQLVESTRHLATLFADASCYIAAVPSYFGGHMAFGWASDDASLRRLSAGEIAGRHRAAGSFPARYWTPEVQAAAFALPGYIADLVAAAEDPPAAA